MKVTDTRIPGLKLIEPAVFGDARGFFLESYNAARFREAGLNHVYVQDNHSLSVDAGVLRGLHYQLNPKAQTKLVRVTAGAVYDVVVDIRRGSPTYGQWQSFILSASNKRHLLVPKGCAHGFCTLVPNTEVQYKVDEFYSPEHDRGIAWNDPTLGIDWPVSAPILSEKDSKHPPLAEADNNFVYEG
ncbi:dTDP-4-dehydrorhamnose 3,5-epimerase [Thermobacillus composti KWC4]|uniref:dTDP-4-dehydrorhamnose 3,5-epimerase n=1 Tax=Thermobacillus composti (strain DSM 18247 / JCM 13945 / KWC4) TaxID=717605 RepID=L0EKW0_THECK|nr:dTDP-4-dehydrorhamnose 3,5-epimerase [Thermobacillus composti]AGA59915.1 dTDP-4-dehydrorhamnose 3,5-epimerase [Thermobacillus composti KWC4]